MAARIIQLNETDARFTGLFAASFIQALHETEGKPVERIALLKERLAHYFECLGADACPKMMTANWLDFTTTSIECMIYIDGGAEHKNRVWQFLEENPAVSRELKAFLEPALAHVKYGYERMLAGGVPALHKVA